MKFRIGMENNIENRSQAWVLGHPGCYAYGADSQAALEAAPGAIRSYAAWIEQHSVGQVRLEVEPVEVVLDESWDVYAVNEDFERQAGGYEVESFFLHDWKPMTEDETASAGQILAWSRQDLLSAAAGLTSEALEVPFPGERWNIAGILRHVAGAEWWYMDRLGLAQPRAGLPQEPLQRLEQVRARLVEILPGLVGSRQVVGIDGEIWSPRKVIRRSAWHERDHVEHILRLRELL